MAEKKVAPSAEEQVQQTEVVFSEKNLHAAYANFARVTATPEEVIVDLPLIPIHLPPANRKLTLIKD